MAMFKMKKIYVRVQMNKQSLYVPPTRTNWGEEEEEKEEIVLKTWH